MSVSLSTNDVVDILNTYIPNKNNGSWKTPC